jgi:hypothetical protein
MGVDSQALRFLLLCKGSVSFERVLMLGRQSCPVAHDELRSALFQIAKPGDDVADVFKSIRDSGFVEPLFHFLGATAIESMDLSSYEGATVLHDLNRPVPDHLKEKFSCVFDAGTLEHIFNFPTAVRNTMEMVAIGAHFVGITPCNNFAGHGFYQFSPELLYRVFSEANGFAVEEMIVCEAWRGAPLYRAVDPDKFGRRVELVNSRPTHIMVRARRTRRADIFQAQPQQSDYTSMWVNHGATVPRPRRLLKVRGIARLAPEPLKKLLRPLAIKLRPFRSAAFSKI